MTSQPSSPPFSLLHPVMEPIFHPSGVKLSAGSQICHGFEHGPSSFPAREGDSSLKNSSQRDVWKTVSPYTKPFFCPTQRSQSVSLLEPHGPDWFAVSAPHGVPQRTRTSSQTFLLSVPRLYNSWNIDFLGQKIFF